MDKNDKAIDPDQGFDYAWSLPDIEFFRDTAISTDFGWNSNIHSPPIQPDHLIPATSSNSEDPPDNFTDPRSLSKVKKKGDKRLKQARFAFVTKSEVDHLEDGYRWRKYGQKAVKNSPFPRSYYKCTNNKCTVKKRVERSSEDPSIVITTYEGQHCHQTSGFPRSVPRLPDLLISTPNSLSNLHPSPTSTQIMMEFPSTSNIVPQVLEHDEFISPQVLEPEITTCGDHDLEEDGLLGDMIKR